MLGSVAALVPSARAEDAPAAAGMRVYRDPTTGAFVPPPPAPAPAATAPVTGQALGTRRFVEVPGTTPAGGVTVDLQGAFQSEVTATVDADGHVSTRCADSAPTVR